MRFRDMIRLRMALKAPDNLARPGRLRTHCFECLEGRQLLSSQPSGPMPEIARLPLALVNDLSTDADRGVVIAKIAGAARDITLSTILSPSTEITSSPPLAGDRADLLVAAREAASDLSVATVSPADPAPFSGALVAAAQELVSGPATGTSMPAGLGSSGGAHGMAILPGLESAFDALIALPAGQDVWTPVVPDRAFFLQGTIEFSTVFAALRDGSPFPGPIHSDLADWLSTLDGNADLVIASGSVATSVPVTVEPRRDEFGAPWGREEFASIPVAGPGMVPGLLGGRAGLAPPVALESPRSLGLAVDDLPRDDSARAETEAAEAADGTSSQDEVGLIGGAIADVEATLSRGADLLAAFSPFERAALEHAIDRFLGEIGELGTVLSTLDVKTCLIPNLMAAAGAVAVFEAVRRRVRGPSGGEDEDAEEDGHAGPPGLPGLPRGWALEEL